VRGSPCRLTAGRAVHSIMGSFFIQSELLVICLILNSVYFCLNNSTLLFSIRFVQTDSNSILEPTFIYQISKCKLVVSLLSVKRLRFYSSMSSKVNSLLILLIDIRLKVGAYPSLPLGSKYSRT